MEPKDLGKREFTPGDPLNPMNGFEPDAPEPGAPDPAPQPPVTPPVTPKQGEPAPKPGDQPQYTEREKQMYARMKKAEDKLKKHNLGEEPPAPPTRDNNPQVGSDPFSLAKTIASLKDFDAEEIDFASTIASAKKISPQEAVKTREFQLFRQGKRDDDLKNNRVPAPGSASPASSLPTSSDIAKMSKADHAKLEKEFNAKQRTRGSGF